jgi:hypothetical protein
VYGGSRRDQARSCSPHQDRDIQQVIDVAVSNNNGVGFGHKMFHRVLDALRVRLDAGADSDLRKIDPRKIGIHKQRVAAGFELITVRA